MQNSIVLYIINADFSFAFLECCKKIYYFEYKLSENQVNVVFQWIFSYKWKVSPNSELNICYNKTGYWIILTVTCGSKVQPNPTLKGVDLDKKLECLRLHYLDDCRVHRSMKLHVCVMGTKSLREIGDWWIFDFDVGLCGFLALTNEPVSFRSELTHNCLPMLLSSQHASDITHLKSVGELRFYSWRRFFVFIK